MAWWTETAVIEIIPNSILYLELKNVASYVQYYIIEDRAYYVNVNN